MREIGSFTREHFKEYIPIDESHSCPRSVKVNYLMEEDCVDAEEVINITSLPNRSLINLFYLGNFSTMRHEPFITQKKLDTLRKHQRSQLVEDILSDITITRNSNFFEVAEFLLEETTLR